MYAQAEIFDSKLSVQLPLDVGSMLLGLLGMDGEQGVAEINAAIMSALYGGESVPNPFRQMYDAVNNANIGVGEALEALLRIGSSQTELILSVDMLVEVLTSAARSLGDRAGL